MKNKLSLILCSAPNMKSARKVAGVLLDKKLAACVSILPNAESHYVWKKKLEKSKEALIWIKARKSDFKAVEREIKSSHPYECPEILQFTVDQGHKPYIQWVLRVCRRIGAGGAKAS